MLLQLKRLPRKVRSQENLAAASELRLWTQETCFCAGLGRARVKLSSTGKPSKCGAVDRAVDTAPALSLTDCVTLGK